ncbi:hypothetical protein GDI3275 [Gluconacetobacter diazotrophicus PA1 5]|uniref:Uncharacterized protein n=1 Tax=Gluconacetobacter diazotrophicus (strain ATCC 49037 / DSM 5601 / CCUG 37298 / CIP 103539 / LMG 7603 / PAl5) TaxID=272568 RepID=A9H176_GLUDA|nr:hypothetical protein GDI3275 [Gluconacetobacter diazotrophicus PA1 5]
MAEGGRVEGFGIGGHGVGGRHGRDPGWGEYDSSIAFRAGGSGVFSSHMRRTARARRGNRASGRWGLIGARGLFIGSPLFARPGLEWACPAVTAA